jgi:hypothetical protein
MSRLLCTLVCGAIGFAAAGIGTARAATLCVGKAPGCFAQIQPALDAASDGDTIAIGPGTFAGGITIRKSVGLVGAAAGATTIRGGGPVITIGRFEGENDLHVAISRVTITGGLNDAEGFAEGGGVWIPHGTGQSPGATVTITSTVIAGNRAAPKATFAEPAPCAVPADRCAFAGGGGIGNSGTLTVTDSSISDNVAGSPGVTSYAFGGGVSNSALGTLTLIRSTVTGNRAEVSAPNGRSTDAGGISSGGALTIEDSVVTGNSSAVTASAPSVFPFDFVEANAGGIYLPAGSSTTIRRSRISSNAVVGSNVAGDVAAEAGGIDADGSLVVVDSSIDHNTATASVPAASGFLAEADGGGLQIEGVTTLSGSRVIGNTLGATSGAGTAFASGGGVFNLGGSLTLERSVVADNSAAATGLGGVNLGGGIGNVQFFGPVPTLTVVDSVVAANRLAASEGVASLGAGIFNLEVTSPDPFVTGAPFPVTLARTIVAGNQPDDCAGC